MAWSSRLLKAEKNMMHGPDILELQLRLEELGYYQGQADGRYTLATQRAVKSFQQALGLKDDGVVGPITWLALNRNAFEHFKAEPALTSPEI